MQLFIGSCMYRCLHNHACVGNKETQNISVITLVTPIDVVTSTGSELDVLIQLRLFKVQTCLEWVVS